MAINVDVLLTMLQGPLDPPLGDGERRVMDLTVEVLKDYRSGKISRVVARNEANRQLKILVECGMKDSRIAAAVKLAVSSLSIE